MDSEVKKEEKQATDCEMLSAELRRMITNITNRNELASTSNKCQSEGHIDTLELNNLPRSDGMIFSIACRPGTMDYDFYFEKRDLDVITVTCQQVIDDRMIWKETFQTPETADNFACFVLQRIMTKYGKKIRALTVRGDLFDFDWNAIGTLENFETLNVGHDKQAECLIAKTKLPLKTLSVGMARIGKEKLSANLARVEKVFSTDNVLLPNTIFNSEQFDRLQATFIYLPVGNIEAQSIVKFINKWKQGQMREDFRKLKLFWEEADQFDIRKIFNSIGVSIVVPSKIFEVHQLPPSSKTADFKYSTLRNHHEILFEVQNPDFLD